jgi:hypothetical protein
VYLATAPHRYAYTSLIEGPHAGRFKVRPCFYPSSQGDSAEVSLRVLENRPDLGRTYRLGRTIQCSRRACVPRAKLRSALGYLIVPLWGGRIRWTRTISVITQQATEVLRLQLRPRCKQERRDKADTAVMQGARRRLRAELRKGE